jgi:hypothetical protein
VPYFEAPALAQLHRQIQERWPHRDRTSDGWIGDTSHAARPSDHNPDWSDGGIVRARDIDEDLVAGLTAAGEAQFLADALLRDPRTRYVIYEGAWAYGQHVAGVLHGWKPYTGSNAHRHHIHISVRDVAGYDRDTRPWDLGTTKPTKEEEDDDMAFTDEDREMLRQTHARITKAVVDGPADKPKLQDRLSIAQALRRILIELGAIAKTLKEK